MSFRHIILATCAIFATSTSLAFAAEIDPDTIRLQSEFDPIGAEVHELETNGRTSYYIDEGRPGEQAVIFIGGAGTSLEAFQLTEFIRSTRQQLGLRMISVERNGFGESKFDPALSYADYNKEIFAVLDRLGVEKFSIAAISGGGAYAAQLAAEAPERVISLHAAAAVSSTLPSRTAPKCDIPLEELKAATEKWTHNPKEWWGVPGSPVLIIPAWQTAAYADATRSFFVAGQMGNPSALAHERMLPCSEKALIDPAKLTMPTYLYWGGEDQAVPVASMKQWQEALPNIKRATIYNGEGHTVQYRHWDQVLVDIAGLGDYTVICDGEDTKLVKAEAAIGKELGLCAWRPRQ